MFCEFVQSDGYTVWVNPACVTSVEERDGKTYIYVTGGKFYHVKDSATGVMCELGIDFQGRR